MAAGLVALSVVAATGACSASGPASASNHSPEPAVSTATAKAKASSAAPSAGPSFPTATSTSRPLEKVPDVKPKGFVDPPPGNGISRYLRQKVVWKGCPTKPVPTKQCATVLTPLDWSKPNGQAITLTMARKPATGHRIGDLFINPGGPGGSGVDFIDYFAAHGLDSNYTIVSWDPRGVGKSTPVECLNSDQMEDYTAADYAPENQAQLTALIKLNTNFGRACLAKSGALLEHISTEDTVRDLDLLRQLLKQKQLNYFGSSYGTSIGAMYATLFPHDVGRMVLDGATDIGGASTISQTYGFDRTLGNFAAWCAKQGCSLGDSKAAVLTTVRHLLQSLDTKTIPGGRRDLTQALATTGLIYALYSPASSWPQLFEGLQLAVNGDGSSMLRWADEYNQRDSNGNFAQLDSAFPAIKCLDSNDGGVKEALKTWHQVEKVAPTIGPFMGPDMGCPTWPVKSVNDLDHKISYRGATDILVLGTTGDPATPYEYAEHMHKALTDSRLITLDGNGHLAFDQSTCVQAKVIRYFDAGTLPKKHSVCTDG